VSVLADVAALWGHDGWLTPPLQPVVPAVAPVSGRARTVRLEVAASGPGMAKAFELLSHDLTGQVVVWAGVAEAPGATWGEILSMAARGQGATAVLVDGAVRDVDDMTQLGLPVYASRTAVVGPNGTVHAVEVDGPVAIDGVRIDAGDTIVVDAAGCIRLSGEHADELLAAGTSYAAGEGALLAALTAGEPLDSAYLHKKRAVDALRR
jgi:4-hydroxy-4-methyl-2-oxoglutarate aldolase